MKTAILCVLYLWLIPLCFAEQLCQSESIVSTAPSANFLDLGDGSVVDQVTGLMWRKCPEGLSGENCELGELVTLTWAGALQYAPKINDGAGFAGYHDWRLPNIRELSTIVDLQCANPAINTDVFPSTPVSHAWTSSPYHFYTHYSWYVDFSSGAPTYDERISQKSVRLVRDHVMGD